MAHLDFYSSQPSSETLSKFLLKRKASSESIRHRLNCLANPPPKHHHSSSTPPLIRISRNILKRKPQHVRHEESELKKITLDRLYFARQQENARIRNQPNSSGYPTKTHIAQQQLNAIKHHIQVIKQDIPNRYPQLPSPKPDNWFRQDEQLDNNSDTTNSSSEALHRRVTQKSRALIEKGVVIHRKIKSITRKNSSSAHSLTSSNFQATTPETTLPSHFDSPHSTHPLSSESHITSRHLLHIPTRLHDSIAEDHLPATPPPDKLSIVTQGLPQPGIERKHTTSADYVPLRPYLQDTLPLSPTHWSAGNSSSALPQWQNSAMVYLADDPTGQIDRWVFSSSLIPHARDPSFLTRRSSHRVSLELPPRDLSETHRRKSESDTLNHPTFSYPLKHTLSPDQQAEGSSSGSPFGGSSVIQDPHYFVEKQRPSQVILATDVLIEQQGGLSFLGKENFNERFRSQPWQTVKTIRQYNRPGHMDAEYIPDVSRVAVVQTPHSTDTFPLPTPEWYSLTGFSIDKQTKSVDPNGWEYYDIFSRKWSPNRHGCRTFIRRRRWVRVRGKLDSSTVPDPSLIQFPSTRVSPLDHQQPSNDFKHPALDDQQPIIVILRKQGVDQFITFNTLTVDGGYTLTFTLPGLLGGMEVHWDDSALVKENPLFSSQIVVAEVLRYVDTVSEGAATHEAENREAIVECLKDELARINLQRVSKILAGLSDLQKINLWNYWLQVDSPSMLRNKPDSEDIWRVLDRHIQAVQGIFVFDLYRAQFLKMVAMLYTHGWSGVVTRARKPRRRGSGQAKAAMQEDQYGPRSLPMTTTTPTQTAIRRLPSRGFLQAGASQPSFLETRNLRLEYWANLVSLFSDPKLPKLSCSPPLFHFPHNHPIQLRLQLAATIRLNLHSYLKQAKKLKHARSSSK